MPSLQAMLFNWYLKATLKPKPMHLIDAGLLRANIDRLAPEDMPDGVSLEIIEDGAVKGEWHRAGSAEAGRTIYYLHGGGYVYGSPKSHRCLTFGLAQESDAEVFSLDYRMAPEHQFPAAVDDAVAGYQWLLDQGRDPAKIVVAGDSAGGGLSLALLLSCKAQRLPMPAGAILYSPWTDLAATGTSLEVNEKNDVMFKKVYIAEGAKRYLGETDPKTPLASPLYADLKGLPPLLAFVSDSESLLDDSTRLQEKLIAAGNDSKLIIENGLAHVWPIFHPRFPETGKAITQSAEFVRGRTF